MRFQKKLYKPDHPRHMAEVWSNLHQDLLRLCSMDTGHEEQVAGFQNSMVVYPIVVNQYDTRPAMSRPVRHLLLREQPFFRGGGRWLTRIHRRSVIVEPLRWFGCRTTQRRIQFFSALNYISVRVNVGRRYLSG